MNFQGDPRKRVIRTRPPIQSSVATRKVPFSQVRVGRKSEPASDGARVIESRRSYGNDRILKSRMPRTSNGFKRSLMENSAPIQKAVKSRDLSGSQEHQQVFSVQGTLYTVRKCIGTGGTSVVYEINDKNNCSFALKKVDIIGNPAPLNSLRGEIELLQHLSSESRVVQLISYEITEKSLMLVMELGEMDLRVLLKHNDFGLNTTFIRYWATEVFLCVKAVHSYEIVHSDLKPENFLVVKGRLKIIDFGIANIVPDYTVNVHRDTKMGTVSYMAPEAVCGQNTFQGPDFKVGKPTDIWSCGCILYKMVYGCTPLEQYGRQQLAVLESESLEINFPRVVKDHRIPKGLLELMHGCLIRDPKKRLTVEEALQGIFLNPRSVDFEFIQDLIVRSVAWGQKYKQEPTKERLHDLVQGVWVKVIELNDLELESENLEPHTDPAET